MALSATGRPIGPYVVQAQIAACHARADDRRGDRLARHRRTGTTCWPRLGDNPVVEVNRAVAHGRAYSPEEGLAVLDDVADHRSLAGSHLVDAVRGDLLARAGRHAEAAEAFDRAASLTGERSRARRPDRPGSRGSVPRLTSAPDRLRRKRLLRVGNQPLTRDAGVTHHSPRGHHVHRHQHERGTVSTPSSTQYAVSADGTRIAYEVRGSGPGLVIVDGALCQRSMGPSRPLAEQLASRFTVHVYDRRGRGESGPGRAAYHPDREVEDLAAVIAAGGHATSSAPRSVLALRAARRAADRPARLLRGAVHRRRHPTTPSSVSAPGR